MALKKSHRRALNCAVSWGGGFPIDGLDGIKQAGIRIQQRTLNELVKLGFLTIDSRPPYGHWRGYRITKAGIEAQRSK